MLAPCSTRWLSTEQSVNRLRKCFISVVLSLQWEGEEWSDAKAVGLNNLVAEYRFVCTMLLLCDALPHVTHLSKRFQSANCDYSIIPRMVSLVPRPSLPAFNVACKKLKEGLVHDVTADTSRISERGQGGAALIAKAHSK